MDDKELDLLDKQEVGYKRIEIPVSVEGKDQEVRCLTYVQKQHESDPRFDPDSSRNLPSLAYKKVMLKGAIENGLPADYLEFLEALPHNGVVDIDRNDGIQSICDSEIFCDKN